MRKGNPIFGAERYLLYAYPSLEWCTKRIMLGVVGAIKIVMMLFQSKLWRLKMSLPYQYLKHSTMAKFLFYSSHMIVSDLNVI